jgi:putative ABC transport system permease protein
MRIIPEFRLRWRSIIRRSQVERDLDEEMRDHVERDVAARVARGMTAEESRRTALLRFGGLQAHKEECRRSLGLQLWDDLIADGRYGLRSLLREPGFALVVVLTLALGIGTNVTIFSAVDAVLLRPLPYSDQQRLVELMQQDARRGSARDAVSRGNFLDWRERSSDMLTMAAAEPYSRTITTSEGPERISSWLVSEGFFEILKLQPLLGRTFTRDEFTPGRERVIVLGYGTWSRHFGGESSAVGRVVVMDGQPFTIIGVMPPQFAFPPGRDVWSPKIFTAEETRQRAGSYFRVVASLKPGVGLRAAQARLDTVARQLQQEYPRENGNVAIAAVPLKESLVGDARPILALFLVGVALLLMVACANVSNLFLLRMHRRRQEFAVRVALGAAIGRVRRQVLTESVVVAFIGATVAVVCARWGVATLRTMVPDTLPRADQMAVGWLATLLAYALALGISAGVSLLSLARSRGSRPVGLNPFARTASSRRGWLQRCFVVVQLAIAMVLVVTAGLFVRSLVTLLGEERGFRTDKVVAVTLFAWQELPQPEQRAQFVQRVVERLESLSGVEDAGAGSSLPLAERFGPENAAFTIPGMPVTPDQAPSAQATIISPGYLESLGIAVREGRAFTWFDRAESAPVIVINERLARRYWPGRSPVGQKMVVRFTGPPVTREIVGVVSDAKRDLTRDAPPALYIPHGQAPTGSVSFVAHTSGDPASLLPAIKGAIRDANPSIARGNVVTLDAVLQSTLSPRRFNLQLVGFFAIAALLLATIGTYGVIAYATNERLKEIGIRIALGGTSRHVVGVVLADGARIAVAGAVAGLLVSVVMSRLVRGMLYGITSLDGPTYAAAVAMVILIALSASGIPAYRASRLDPLKVLRSD